MAAITVTEFLIVVKYDPNTIMLPIPFFIMQCWFLGLIVIIIWTIWKFFIRYIWGVRGVGGMNVKGQGQRSAFLFLEKSMFPYLRLTLAASNKLTKKEVDEV